jgi:predicted O-methyltransferase YrrM
MIFNATLPEGSVDRRSPSEADAAAAHELREQVRTDERLVPLLLPFGDGFLAAVKEA